MLGNKEFDFNAEVFDSRDVIDRIEYLESIGGDALMDLDADERDEWTKLKAIADEGESAAEDWEYGETFIAEWHFVDYAQELAEDIGAIDPNAGWPLTCINWERAARELKYDYNSIEVNGTTYYCR